MSVDPHKIAEILEDCVNKYIVPRYKTLTDDQVNTKSHADDLVTIADIETEQALREILPRTFPGYIVIGEESVSSGAASLDILKDRSQKIFVVDPVDGTFNFRHGKREFAVMMALVEDGETRMAWIYDVLGNKHAIAEKGAGAFFGNLRMQVAPAKPIDQCRAFINPGYFPKEMRPFLDHIRAEVKTLKSRDSLRCSAHEYLQICTGQADFAINGWMKPWDHLAGALMTAESGGVIRKWDGSDYAPQDENGGLIVASNQSLWDHVQAQFLNPCLRKMGASGLAP